MFKHFFKKNKFISASKTALKNPTIGLSDLRKKIKSDNSKKKAEPESDFPEEMNEMQRGEAINKKTEEAKRSRQLARQEGKTYGEEVLNRNLQGLTPQQRSAMQYEANRNIEGDLYRANQKLSGEQGRRGIGHKSGVAFAQQQALQRQAQEARGQSTRDVERLNADLALKKLAALFNIEQGEASQSQLDRQAAQDELELADERKRQRGWENKFNRLFSRV